MRPMDKLWRKVGYPGRSPCADPKRIKARVNAALDADPVERKIYMKQKLRIALTIAAVAAAITGSALAAGENWDMLTAFFKGDTSPAQGYVDNTTRTVSDENYTLTIESSVADGENIYLVATVTALSEDAKAFLNDKSFHSLDTWWWRTAEYDAYLQENPDAVIIPDTVPKLTSAGGGELPCALPDSRRFSLSATVKNGPTTSLLVRLRYMDEDAVLEIPVTPAPSATVSLGATGLGIPDYDSIYPTAVTIAQVQLSPFNCAVICSDVYLNYQYTSSPNLAFRMADGQVRTLSQMTIPQGSDYANKNYNDENGLAHGSANFYYRFREVQKLENIVSILAFDTEYPLDGSTPFPVDHDPLLDPFTLPVMEALSDNVSASIPVRALTEKLGGTCDWDLITGNVTCTYRRISIVFQPGDDKAFVNGAPVAMSAPSQIQNGLTVACANLFEDAWGIASNVMRQTLPGENGETERVIDNWLVIP